MKTILNYLAELEQNNNREWFNHNKPLRDTATKEFLELIQSLIFSIGQTDNSILHNTAKELTFKQVRDIRFSADKTPYNPTLKAHIGPCGKLPIPVGYFIFIKPDNRSFIGGGLFTDMFKNATTMIRDYIVDHGEQLDKIVNDEKFRKYFELKGEKLKKVPASYDDKNKWSEYLKYKSMYIEYFISDEQLLNEKLVENLTEIFTAMKPFNDFLNRALKNYEIPSR